MAYPEGFSYWYTALGINHMPKSKKNNFHVMFQHVFTSYFELASSVHSVHIVIDVDVF